MKKIDFHAHYLTPSYKTFVLQNFNAQTPQWSADDQLALHRDNDIVYSLMGISTPYFTVNDMDETYKAVVKSNDEIAQMIARHKNELGFMAALPIPDIKRSLDEIERVMRLGAKGFTFDTNMGGVYLGDPILNPVMAKLNELHAIAAFHPTTPATVPKGVLDNFRVQALEFFYDTTRTFINMSRNHIFTDYPNIRWIVPHAGALIPAISDRVQSSFRMEGKGSDLYADLQHVYFDITGSVEPKLLNLLKLVAPVEHFLYGSDFPYASTKDVQKYRLSLEETDKLTVQEKEMAFYRNGASLLGMEF